jgi:hypothetical protein
MNLERERQPDWTHLDRLEMTPERRQIVEQLKLTMWFQNTSPELQTEVVSLPQEGKENHDGFLQDLMQRPSELGGVRVQRLVELPRGSFALIPKFEVLNEAGISYTYEYVSWRHGPESGAKGLVFVRSTDGGVSHFIVLRGDKFATGKREWDTVGGFIDKNVEGVQTVMQRIDKEIKEELGVEDIKINGVRDLGVLAPDAGMTNNRPGLFAAFISAEEASKISDEPLNPDVYELRAGAIVFPISQLPEIIMRNSDSFFHATILRSIAFGILPPGAAVGEANKNSSQILN